MRPQDLISKKRDGEKFSPEEIDAFVTGVCDGTWADYQTSALLMAMFINGLDQREQNALTLSMVNSGEVLDFSGFNGAVADKHSTGGVGDKTSLLIAPIAAACGLVVPMISGRGLGHTGGTLDKLESIPNYDVRLSKSAFSNVIGKCGFAMNGQTDEIAPADRILYALRDTTATIESIPLMVASIMSKKLAEGLDALVLDVKTGTGAFMEDESDAKALAKALVKTGNDCGVKTEAVISDMNQPLGLYIGNALEVFECLKILRGESTPTMQPTLDLSIELTARLLVLTGIAEDLDAAVAVCTDKVREGQALEKFRENIKLQNGDPRVCDDPEMLLEKNVIEVQIKSAADGFVEAIDARSIGEAICAIGGGRLKTDDEIDAAVGFACHKKLGDEVKEHEPLGVLYCRSEGQAAAVLAKLQMAYKIGFATPVRKFELVKDVVSEI